MSRFRLPSMRRRSSSISSPTSSPSSPHSKSFCNSSRRHERAIRAEAAMTEDVARLTARVDALEMRATEQERTIEDLNATILAQWKEIEELKRQLARL